ncbi:hypothetical protein WJX81_004878 [Elliptochloris bilobata]|uniref:Major facilitator superfamily (MFS) profile domain-containing protein n=1 Tax=Elliptochloris bilobata TaxID=381761 RepID=A0AAW1SBT7_9CHLO
MKFRTAVAVALVQAADHLDEALLTSLYLPLSRTLDVSPTGLGGLSMARSLVKSLVSPAAGVLGDRCNRMHVIVVGTACWVVFTLLFGFARQYAEAAAWAACTGVGLALVFPASQSLIADLFAPEKRGRAFGALLTVAALAGMAGSFFSIQMGSVHFYHLPGWRLAYWVVAGLGAAAAVLAWLAIVEPRSLLHKPSAPPGGPPPRRAWLAVARAEVARVLRDFWAVLKVPTFVVMMAEHVVGTISWSSGYRTMYFQLLGFSTTATGIMVQFTTAGAAAGFLIGGYIGDAAAKRYPNAARPAIIQLSLVLGAPLSVIMYTSAMPGSSSHASGVPGSLDHHAYAYATLMFFSGLVHTWAVANNIAIMSEIVPAALRSSVFALDRCIAGVLGAALAPLVGILAERCFGYDNTRHRHLPPPTTTAGFAAQRALSAVIAAQNVNNAHALERGLLLVLVIPMGVKFLIYCALYWTLPRDRIAEPAPPDEDSDSDSEGFEAITVTDSPMTDSPMKSAVLPERPQSRELGQMAAAADDAWKAVLDKVVPACVVLKVTQTRSFDTEAAGASHATGFIVDASRGIILTNRHVVTPGPTTAGAVFLNHEELSVRTIYRDPVHDFAFLCCDLGALKFMMVGEVALAPEAAAVGLDVRVVGNDSGEKVSILAGTIARLDRDAPNYGGNTFNDFNTFYLQAASGTKGGSSGSPVVARCGRAVGLNAGGKNKASSAYYLPLHRVVRALQLIQAGMPVGTSPERWPAPRISRGDLQATFTFKGFDDVRRLGLRAATEAAVRACSSGGAGAASSSAGMLVVESVVPGGPACDALEPGDVLVRLQGAVTTHFLPMEALLDESVGRHVGVEVERGGVPLSFDIKVQDLHAVTPASMLEVAGGAVHALSYQQARNHRTPTGQVYVAEAGYMLSRAGVPKHAIITQLAGTKTPDLATFAAVLRGLAHGMRVPLRYFVFSERHRSRSALLHVDRAWYGTPLYWERDETTGSMVLVEVDIPPVALIDGVHSRCFAGNGVVIHQSDALGLVVVDRNTVAIGAGDVRLTFGAAPAEVDAAIRFLHPLHNFALLSYDPAVLPPEARAEVRAAVLDPSPVATGETVRLAGLSKECRLLHRASRVINAHFALAIKPIEVPRFRACHEEVVKLDHDFGSTFSGMLTDDAGRMRALWASYSEQVGNDEREWCAGLPAATLAPWIAAVLASMAPAAGPGAADPNTGAPVNPNPAPLRVAVLGAELEPLLLSRAAQHGLPREWVSRLTRLDPLRRQVLRVRSRAAGGHAAEVLHDGDMVLAVAGQPVASFAAVERALLPAARDAEQPAAGDAREVALSVCRDGAVLQLGVRVGEEDGLGTPLLVHWAGAQLQAPHRAVREQGYVPEGGGVFISRWHHGSPAHRYGLYALHFITEVNGTATPDLEAFVSVARRLEDSAFVRVKLVHLESAKTKVLALKQDLLYWPTWELRLDAAAAAWRRTVIAPAAKL